MFGCVAALEPVRARSPPPSSGILTRFPFDWFGVRSVAMHQTTHHRPLTRRSLRIVASIDPDATSARAHHLCRPVDFFELSFYLSRARDYSYPVSQTEFSNLLGSTDPCPTAVHMEPFSTSVYKVLVCILATTTKICTEGGSTRARAQRFRATDTPSYSSRPGIAHALSRRRGMGATLQRHPFSGLVDSAGELLHTP